MGINIKTSLNDTLFYCFYYAFCLKNGWRPAPIFAGLSLYLDILRKDKILSGHQ